MLNTVVKGEVLVLMKSLAELQIKAQRNHQDLYNRAQGKNLSFWHFICRQK